MASNVVLIISIILISGLIFFSGCVQQEQKSELPIITISDINKKLDSSVNAFKTLKGVTLTPKSFGSDDFVDFFAKAKLAGNIVTWSGDWLELSNEKSGPQVLVSLSANFNYEPIIVLQFFTQSDGKLLRPLDVSNKQKYKNSTIDFVKKYKPKYLGIGIEVNVLFEKSPADFEEFILFYNELYDAVKQESKETKVFTVFQLEKMKGLNGGLFGGVNDAAKSQWFLLDKFKSDVFAFTTYPGLIYKNPAEIPKDYYLEIKSHTSKPIAFTEIGWHSNSELVGWESSELEQAEFVSSFFNLTKDLNTEFLVWSFLYDQNTFEPFSTMGLFGKDGVEKKAWGVWVAQAKPI